MIHRAPGVYLRNQGFSRAAVPPSGIPTMVGIASRGPHHRLERIDSWDDFLDVFGDIVAYGHLPASIYGFFQNGGETCFVVRVLREPQAPNAAVPPAARDILAQAVPLQPIVDHNGDACIRLRAINHGRWGDAIEVTTERESEIGMELARLSAPISAAVSLCAVDSVLDFFPGFRATVVDSENPFIKRDVLIQSIDKVAGTLNLTAPVGADFPAGSVLFGPGFTLSVVCGSRAEQFAGLSMNPRHPHYFLSRINGEGFYIDRRDAGHSILVHAEAPIDASGLNFFRPESAQVRFGGGGDGFVQASATLGDSLLGDSLRVFSRIRGRAGERLRVEAKPFVTTLAFRSGLADQVVLDEIDNLSVNDAVTLHDETAGVSEIRAILFIESTSHRVTLDAATTHDFPDGSRVESVSRFVLEVYQEGKRLSLERFENLGMDSADTQHFAESVVNARSEWILVQALSATPPSGAAELVNGRDPGEIDADYYIGLDDSGNPIAGPDPDFASAFGLALDRENPHSDGVAVPDLIRAPAESQGERAGQWQRVTGHASQMGDRLAFIDPDPGMDAASVITLAKSLAPVNKARFGALYYPHLVCVLPSGDVTVPPSGAMAGVYRRVDRAEGLGRAPANFEMKGVVKPETEIDAFDQALLNEARVNCIRVVEPGWAHILGARTLSLDGMHLFLTGRRILNNLHKVLRHELLWTVFEPNGPELWRRIELALRTRLSNLAGRGLTAPGGAGQAFFVQCDPETNTDEATSGGMVVARIGIALSRPAEFIEIHLNMRPETIAVTEPDL